MAEVALQERVAHLEGKVGSFDGRFDSLDRQIHGLELRIDALDQKVDRFRDELGARISGVEERLSVRILELDRKIDRNFQWTTGINVVLWSTILVAVFLHA